jgi:NAD+ kinase
MASTRFSVSEPKTVGIVSKPDKPELAGVLPELLKWFENQRYQVVIDRETAAYTGGVETVNREQLAARALSFIVVLGGDGTLLSASRAVAKAGIPVLGVNLGSLGFLTDVRLEDLYATLDDIEAGKCHWEPRSMVSCEVLRKNSRVVRYDALNDIVVGKGMISRLNHCDVYIDGVFVSSYQADSLIISTPTGSTAYSLAAGGPILMPSVDALIVNPVSPHSFTHRSLIVPDTSKIELIVRTGQEEAYLSVDGQVGMPMYDGDRVQCCKSEHQVKLLRTHGTFFDVLRAKLKWGQR